jgi:hypothetical protein
MLTAREIKEQICDIGRRVYEKGFVAAKIQIGQSIVAAIESSKVGQPAHVQRGELAAAAL